MQKSITTRPHFVSANPYLAFAHRKAQQAMFGAASKAGLPTSDAHKDAMIDGINDALGLKGSKRLVSRAQLTVVEQQAITEAIQAGMFASDWLWDGDFTIHVQFTPVTMTVEQATIIPKATGEAITQLTSLSGPVPDWIAPLL